MEILKKKFWSRWVESTEGYRARLVARVYAEYEDADGRVVVSAEMLSKPRSWALYPKSMWESGIRGRRLTDAKRKRLVAERVLKAASFAAIKLSVHPPDFLEP